ncbi:GXWXG domain-containing protein [Terrihabitans sp. B22-R8]|uniref:GXWXG domain-containing protein n=1 Tax=Terrihabitans sp. B22-R8 TaxID=3425128 RepID=UPI00403CF07B
MMIGTPYNSALDRLAELPPRLPDVLAFFDSLPPVEMEMMTGFWRGTGVPSGHDMDGLLEMLGWYGKAFLGPESVHPLLFHTGKHETCAVDPSLIPVWVARFYGRRLSRLPVHRPFRAALPLLRTSKPKASLKRVAHRGAQTTAMIYDARPIRDVFRTIDGDTVLGLMEMDGMQPFFFALHREPSQTGVVSRPLLATR